MAGGLIRDNNYVTCLHRNPPFKLTKIVHYTFLITARYQYFDQYISSYNEN